MQDDIPIPRYTLLDGGTATSLFGAGMKPDECPETWMLSHPDEVLRLQRAYVEAGSEVLYAPTFSANEARLSRFGLEKEAERINAKLAALTKQAAAGRARVAGNLSPTGLSIEPAGETSFDELCRIYADQAAALDDAGVDLFVIETMLSVTEARAAVMACRKYKKPVWVTMTLDQDGMLLSGGQPLACLITLQRLGVDGFGFNCGAGIEGMVTALRTVSPYASVPLIAKPNILPEHACAPEQFADWVRLLLNAGASIVGGCCGTAPEHIRAAHECLRRYEPHPMAPLTSAQENDIWLTNEKTLFALDEDRIEFTAPIACSHDMSDDFFAAERDSFDVMLVSVETPDDALDFARNAPFAALPVCFQSEDPEALSRALFLYNGRAMVDSNSTIEESRLRKIADRYGAFVY